MIAEGAADDIPGEQAAAGEEDIGIAVHEGHAVCRGAVGTGFVILQTLVIAAAVPGVDADLPLPEREPGQIPAVGDDDAGGQGIVETLQREMTGQPDAVLLCQPGILLRMAEQPDALPVRIGVLPVQVFEICPRIAVVLLQGTAFQAEEEDTAGIDRKDGKK